MTFIGAIPVDRSSTHGMVGQIVEEFNSQSKMIFAVASEGTRSKIFPWKTGFSTIVHKNQVPVQLISSHFANEEVRIGFFFYDKGEYKREMQNVYDYYAWVPAIYVCKVLFRGPRGFVFNSVVKRL